jgi:hypothetical protein
VAGRPLTSRRLLVALWIYATIEGISSARQLEERCYRDIAFKWLRGGVDVNYHTLADFRVTHREWLEAQVVLVVGVMMNQGLVTLNKVGQDGMRVRASAGSGSFKTEPTIDRNLSEAQDQWDRLQQEFDGPSGGRSTAERAAQQRALRDRLERLQRAKEEHAQVAAARELRGRDDRKPARISITDPEARVMKMADGGYRPAYNVQFATDLDSLVIVGVKVVNAASDGGQMDPMIQQIQDHYGRLPEGYFTDGGFSTKEDIEKVAERGVVVFTPLKDEHKKLDNGKDPYAPQRGDKPGVAQWRSRMGTAEAKEKYKQRVLCEWPNAMCRLRNLWQFAVRGDPKVNAVVLWHVLVHNLGRLAALRGATN